MQLIWLGVYLNNIIWYIQVYLVKKKAQSIQEYIFYHYHYMILCNEWVPSEW